MARGTLKTGPDGKKYIAKCIYCKKYFYHLRLQYIFMHEGKECVCMWENSPVYLCT